MVPTSRSPWHVRVIVVLDWQVISFITGTWELNLKPWRLLKSELTLYQKTQCNGDLPCNRCQRLGLECTQTRPVLAKGRPKRDASTPRPKRPLNASHHAITQRLGPQSSVADVVSYPPASDSSLELVRHLPELPLPAAVAAHLLDLVLSPISTVGLLEVFPSIRPSSSKHGDTGGHGVKRHQALPSTQLSKPLLYTLLVVSASLFHPPDSSINMTSLQQYALNYVPALYGNSRELKMDDALSLCLLSYIGCLNVATLKVAERWAVLAVTVAHQARVDEEEHNLDSETFNQRVSWLICVNDRIFSLLHYRQPLAKTLGYEALSVTPKIQSNPTSIVVDKMSIGGVLQQPVDDSTAYMNLDYFSLYMPLLEAFDMALEEPKTNSKSWENALATLDNYYARLPQDILTYHEINQLSQLEALLWFHGIHLLLYGSRDLYSCFDDRLWSAASLVKATEYSIAFGEILPSAIQCMNSASQLSPATIYFLALSSIVHAVLLRNLLGSSSSSNPSSPQSNTEQSGWSTLLESAQLHLFTLRRINEDSVTCTVDLIQVVEGILHQVYTAATTDRRDWELDYSALRFYRWTGRGRGVVKISPRVADELSRLSMVDMEEHKIIQGTNSGDIMRNEALTREILAICAADTRRSRHTQHSRGLSGMLS